jgi:TPR repeat protein
VGACPSGATGRPVGHHPKAAQWHHKAAEQGLANAQYSLGFCYANGKGVKQNSEEALKWYQKAADQGFVAAQTAIEAKSPKLYRNRYGQAK